MRIKVGKEKIFKALQTTQSAINPRAGLPILANLLIEAKNGKIRIVGTDLDIGIISNFEDEVLTEGSITVPAKKFSDIIRELSGDSVIINAKKNNIVTIESGSTFFKIMGLPKEEYPKLPEFPDASFISIPQKTLKTMLTMTHFAISRDETRYILKNIACIVMTITIVIRI